MSNAAPAPSTVGSLVTSPPAGVSSLAGVIQPVTSTPLAAMKSDSMSKPGSLVTSPTEMPMGVMSPPAAVEWGIPQPQKLKQIEQYFFLLFFSQAVKNSFWRCTYVRRRLKENQCQLNYPLNSFHQHSERRRENMARGQAELERRRSQLADAAMKEKAERERKEREEAEKREKLRLEAQKREQEELLRKQKEEQVEAAKALVESKKQDLETNKSQLSELSNTVTELGEKCARVWKLYEERREEYLSRSSAPAESAWNAGRRVCARLRQFALVCASLR
ncbi:hypothetical protein HF086_002460 [Spodoptera exigua]|uniref:Uncharacterized protein n=1 Tax=Spodoptera exigua TaxID=7107 RepID=A0A922SFL2_SPOEX|nr:hypothetical protein HF086_002460 [Spodoptera exigua]